MALLPNDRVLFCWYSMNISTAAGGSSRDIGSSEAENEVNVLAKVGAIEGCEHDVDNSLVPTYLLNVRVRVVILELERLRSDQVSDYRRVVLLDDLYTQIPLLYIPKSGIPYLTFQLVGTLQIGTTDATNPPVRRREFTTVE